MSSLHQAFADRRLQRLEVFGMITPFDSDRFAPATRFSTAWKPQGQELWLTLDIDQTQDRDPGGIFVSIEVARSNYYDSAPTKSGTLEDALDALQCLYGCSGPTITEANFNVDIADLSPLSVVSAFIATPSKIGEFEMSVTNATFSIKGSQSLSAVELVWKINKSSKDISVKSKSSLGNTVFDGTIMTRAYQGLLSVFEIFVVGQVASEPIR